MVWLKKFCAVSILRLRVQHTPRCLQQKRQATTVILSKFNASSIKQTCATSSLSTTRESTLALSAGQFMATMGVCLPCFAVAAENIEILRTPDEFYRTLKAEISTAKRRITWAALYLGTDQLEQELVTCLSERLASCTDLNVTMLLDHARGTRGGTVNSCTMLHPLLERAGSRVHVALYHTPMLRGLLKHYLPGKLSETVGLSHIKVFVFDDNVLVSGANLSSSYFTNRQDRYIIIRNSRQLTDFFDQLVRTISTFSFKLSPGGRINLHPECPSHPFTGDVSIFETVARGRVLDLMERHLPSKDVNLKSLTKEELLAKIYEQNILMTRERTIGNLSDKIPSQTYVYPLLQMGQLGICFDELALETVLVGSPVGSRIHLASGYFNLTDDYIDMIVHKSSVDYRILTASPQVNGFYGARGIVGTVPDVYSCVSKQFCDKVRDANAEHRIKMYEYYRPEWTFHVKGLWYYDPGEELPCLTLIGSPNFGYRSVHRDLETQIAIVTTDADLQRRLHEEQTSIYALAESVDSATFHTPERRVPLWVRLGTKLLKTYF